METSSPQISVASCSKVYLLGMIQIHMIDLGFAPQHFLWGSGRQKGLCLDQCWVLWQRRHGHHEQALKAPAQGESHSSV